MAMQLQTDASGEKGTFKLDKDTFCCKAPFVDGGGLEGACCVFVLASSRHLPTHKQVINVILTY